MSGIPIPEHAVGRVGMVAALKRVAEVDVGKLVVVREPVGFVTALLRSERPVFAWHVLALGAPIECNGHAARSIYVADQCLSPLGKLPAEAVAKIAKAKGSDDHAAAMAVLQLSIGANAMSREEFAAFVAQATPKIEFERVLEILDTERTLREIGFLSKDPNDKALLWVGVYSGTELTIDAGVDWSGQWRLAAHAVMPQQLVCGERLLRREAPRGETIRTVLQMWRTAFGNAATVPDCLQPGLLYEQHLAEISALAPGLPTLWVDPKVFRMTLSWLRERQPALWSDGDTLRLSYSNGLLRMDIHGVAYGCPAQGHWALECSVSTADLLGMAPALARRRSIRLELAGDRLLVNGVAIKATDKDQSA